MKRILLTVLALFVMSAAFAYDPQLTQNSNSYTMNVSCSSTTATRVFTDNAVTSVQYDNQSAYPITISTYAITNATALQGGYTIPSGRTSSALLTLPTWRFQYALAGSSNTVPSSQWLSVIIIK